MVVIKSLFAKHVQAYNYVHMHIYIADMRTKEVSKCTLTSEQAFLVKIANSNVMPTLHGFNWYLSFGAQV